MQMRNNNPKSQCNLMKIIEQTIQGKRSQDTCEDGIAVGKGLLAVIDGSTSKSPIMVMPGTTNGRYCMQCIKRDIEAMSADVSLQQLCIKLTDTIRCVYNSQGIDLNRLKDNPVERLTASVAVYSEYYGQIWMIGDCQCLVEGEYVENGKPLEAVLAARRADFLNNRLKEGASIAEFQHHDTGRDLIINDIIEGCKRQNIDYSVVDGFDVPIDKVKVVNVPRGSEVVMASDGFPKLCNTLKESEEFLACQLREDPLCINIFKATKGLMCGNQSFDDRCYVRFTCE